MSETENARLLQSFSNAVTELADSVAPAVVGVDTRRRNGTGVVWSEGGLILTASHVVGASEDARVEFSDGTELGAKVLGRDPYMDVALLKVEGTGFSAVKVGTSSGVRVGQLVLAFASSLEGRPSATSGIVTSHRKSMRGFWGATIDDAVVSDAKLNPGYSGGPLVDVSGRMIGMNVAYFAGRGVAVSVDSLKGVVQKISRDGRVRRGFLGVEVEPIGIPGELSESLGIGHSRGLLVRAVESGSPAREAGVTMGDIILTLGGASAPSPHDLWKTLSDESVGKPTALEVLRSEKVVSLEVIPREAGE